ncbi:hypothetical protein [Methanotorris igneus]|uniref:Methylene-tetrahydrofolate reductase C-terminal domain-containing protein n=1 Tax=Methanotorris igneus (strain DSM 5666 / JCM 11834 / Kol 5) TaxID=880724 RepID=F6BAS0_METIK|nr:hypothetical protein [Methanotorris igneus]AEF95884.1 hypothetical protein Metig_0328 [Methanotorris igneus Kol 5]
MAVITIKKDFVEIKRKLMEKNVKTVMVIGCGICAKSSKTGGPEEVKEMKKMLIEEGFRIFEDENLPDSLEDGLCRYSAVEKLAKSVDVDSFDSILVLACGAGLKCIADNFKDKKIISGVNTIGIGIKEKLVCLACGDCGFDDGVCKRLAIIEEINKHLKRSYNT